jgi:hypothetical protein
MPQEHEAKDSQLLNKIEKFQQAKFMVWLENNFIKIVFGVLIFYVFPLIFLSAFLNKQFQEQSALPLFFCSIISSILLLLMLFRILQFFLFIITTIIRVTQQNRQ